MPYTWRQARSVGETTAHPPTSRAPAAPFSPPEQGQNYLTAHGHTHSHSTIVIAAVCCWDCMLYLPQDRSSVRAHSRVPGTKNPAEGQHNRPTARQQHVHTSCRTTAQLHSCSGSVVQQQQQCRDSCGRGLPQPERHCGERCDRVNRLGTRTALLQASSAVFVVV